MLEEIISEHISLRLVCIIPKIVLTHTDLILSQSSCWTLVLRIAHTDLKQLPMWCTGTPACENGSYSLFAYVCMRGWVCKCVCVCGCLCITMQLCVYLPYKSSYILSHLFLYEIQLCSQLATSLAFSQVLQRDYYCLSSPLSLR